MGGCGQLSQLRSYCTQAALKYLQGRVEFFVSHVQRHKQTDNVVVGPRIQQKNSVIETMMHQLLCGFGAGCSICFDELHGLHRAHAAHVADKRMLPLPRSRLPLKLFAQSAGTRQQLAIGKFFEHRQCGGATCRVATESPAQTAGAGASMISARPVIGSQGQATS